MQAVFKAVPVLLKGAKSARNLSQASTKLGRQKSLVGRIQPAYDTYKSFRAVGDAIDDFDAIYKEHRRHSHSRHTDHHSRPRDGHNSRRDHGYDRYGRSLDRGYYQPRSHEPRRHTRAYSPDEDYYAPPPRPRTVYTRPSSRSYRRDSYEYMPRSSTWAESRYYRR